MATRKSRSIDHARLPQMSATALVVLMVALRTALHDARAAQVRASKARAANSASRKGREEEVASVPVAIAPGVTTCMKRMTAVCERLEHDVQAASRKPDRETLRLAVQRYRTCWRALRSFVDAFGALEAGEEFNPSALRAASKVVFGGKRPMTFVREAEREMWSKGRQKLALVESHGLAAEVTALGGGVILARLHAQHDALGAALGVTEVKRASEPRGLSATMAQARALVSEYAIKVAAMIDEEVPGSAELAAQLTAPVAELRKNTRRATKRAAGENPTNPTEKTEPRAPAPVAEPVVVPVAPPEAAPTEPALKPTGTG